MSKKRDRLSQKSMAEAQWYDSLSAEKKRGYTRASVISCEHVKKKEWDTHNVSDALLSIQRKGALVTNLTIDFTTKLRRRNEVIGIGTKGKIAFLVRYHGYTVVGL